MATESPLDRLYVGEHKVLRWTVRDKARRAVNVTGWALAVTLYRRRESLPVQSLSAAVVDGLAGIVAVDLPATVTTALGKGSYRAVLSRTDPGQEQVLASEDVILRARGE